MPAVVATAALVMAVGEGGRTEGLGIRDWASERTSERVSESSLFALLGNGDCIHSDMAKVSVLTGIGDSFRPIHLFSEGLEFRFGFSLVQSICSNRDWGS